MKDEIQYYDRASKAPARQGDFFLEATAAAFPDGLTLSAKNQGAYVLAVGETSNHRHQMLARGTKLYERGGMRYIEVTAKGGALVSVTTGEGAPLDVPRHHTIHLPPGKYMGWTQREWTAADEVRQVQD